MSDLTEVEILDRMKTSYRDAIKHCNQIAELAAAKLPTDGPSYPKLREDLNLIEGCCRQMHYWREDYRWLNVGAMIAQARNKAGNWLRQNSKTKYLLFLKLAEALQSGLSACESLRDKATGVSGPILPAPLIDPTPRSPVVSVPRMSAGGIILPPSFNSAAVH